MKTQSTMASAPLSEQSCAPEAIRLMKVVTGFFTGGTELQVLNLAREIDRGQFDLSFSCLEREGDHLDAYEALRAPISEFRIKRLYHPGCFLQQYRCASLMRKQRIQIMHSYNFHANVFALPAARLAGVPVVIASVRDRGVYLSAAQKRLQRQVLGLADRVLVNADSIRDWLVEQGLREERISVIKNGIDLSRFPQVREPSTVRQELGIADSAPIVILLARLDPQKGIDDFIKAVALVAPQHPQARFLIVGATLNCTDGVISEDTQYPQEMRQLAKSLGVAEQIVFTGHRNDTPDLLGEAAISVLPSLSEGLSNTLIESMAAGLPTIATNVGGNPELVREGVNGMLVPVKSPEHLAQAMGSLLADPGMRKTLGARGRDMVTETHALPSVVAKTQRLYHEQLQHAKRSLT